MDESIIVTIYFITFALLVLLGFYFLMKLNSNLSEKGEKERMKIIRWGIFRKEYFNETGQKYRNYVHYIAILMFIVFFLFIIILIISLQLKKIAP